MICNDRSPRDGSWWPITYMVPDRQQPPCWLEFDARHPTNLMTNFRSVVPVAGIKGMDKQLHPTLSVECKYLSLSLIPASGTNAYGVPICELTVWTVTSFYPMHSIATPSVVTRIWLTFFSVDCFTTKQKEITHHCDGFSITMAS